MTDDNLDPYEREFQERLEWRKKRQIENLKELAQVAQTGGGAALDELPRLVGQLYSSDPKDALRWSILMLWCEAAECYIYGEFQSCILTCGAITERCLKLEYQTIKGPIPKKSYWTLGKCIQECKGIVDPQVLTYASSLLEPRNNRAHALLEHADPQLSIIGGADRGTERLSDHHYHVEPYRGDARNVISLTYKMLKALYG